MGDLHCTAVNTEISKAQRIHTIICCQLRAIAVPQQYGRCVCLESGDGFRPTRLPDGIDRLTHTDSDLQWLQVGVERHQHARRDGRRNHEQQIVRLGKDDCMGELDGSERRRVRRETYGS
jgi:hypothetical protein